MVVLEKLYYLYVRSTHTPHWGRSGRADPALTLCSNNFVAAEFFYNTFLICFAFCTSKCTVYSIVQICFHHTVCKQQRFCVQTIFVYSMTCTSTLDRYKIDCSDITACSPGYYANCTAAMKRKCLKVKTF